MIEVPFFYVVSVTSPLHSQYSDFQRKQRPKTNDFKDLTATDNTLWHGCERC